MEELDFEQKLDFQNGKKLDFEQILLQIMQFYTKKLDENLISLYKNAHFSY